MGNKHYKYLFFDMDGTISDSYPGIAVALDATFKHYGANIDKSSYGKYIGPPLSDTFRDIFGKDKTYEVVAWFRDYYVNNGCLYDNYLYDGLSEALKALKGRGYVLCIASCKKQEEVESLIERFGIRQHFTFVSGLVYGKREQKAEVLGYAVEKLNAKIEDCVMIGDTVYDIQGAASFDMDCILCKWGFGDERAVGDNVVFKAERPQNLLDFLV